MRSKFIRPLIASVLLASLAVPLFACTKPGPTEDTAAGTTAAVTAEQTSPETDAETEAAKPLPTQTALPDAYTKADIEYVCDDGSVLYTFHNKSQADYEAACADYKDKGFHIYSTLEMDGNPATTFVGQSVMAHGYYTAYKGELNIVLSDTAADTLPPATPAVTDGEIECTITQIQDTQNFIGMGYVIQLKDGSFIVYDGSYANQATKILGCIRRLHKGEGKPIIRAWLLTHSHNDHYPAFEMIANKNSYRSQLVVEHVIVSPLNDANFSLNQDEEFYLSTKLYDDAALFGAKVVFAHTGMNFTFCNLNMEILYAPESTYKYSADKGNFNSTSIVSRLYDDSYSALFTGDVSTWGVDFVMEAYGEGDYLKSDVCQMSHHGVEGIYILPFYDKAAPQIMFYPASVSLFTSSDPAYSPEVHNTLFTRDYIKEILVHGYDQFTRAWGTKLEDDAPLSVPGFVVPEPVIGEEASVQNGTGTRASLRIDDWMGYRVTVNGEITGFSYDVPTWMTTTSDCTLALYKWNTDIATTLAAEPIESKRAEDLVDNATTRFNFDKPQPAGEYLFVIRDVDGTVGVYYNQGSVGGQGTLYTPDGESTDQPTLKISFSDLPAAPFGNSADSLTVDKTSYTEGEAIMVTAYGTGKYRVGIAKKGATEFMRWWYLAPQADGVHAPVGEAFDLTTLPANGGSGKLPAGDYTIYLFGNSGSIAEGNFLTRADLTITAAEGQTPAEPSLTPTIHIDFDGNTNAAEDTVTALPHGNITYEEGKNGQAAVLGSAYVSVPGFKPAGSFTVMVWAKISNLTGDPALFATKEWAGGSNVGFALGVNSDKLHANIGDGERREDMKPSLEGVDLSGWNHYTLVFDRDAREMRVSVNFGEFATCALPAELVNAPYEGTGSLVIGQDATGHYDHGSMTCIVDDFMVFDRALTQAELAELNAR